MFFYCVLSEKPKTELREDGCRIISGFDNNEGVVGVLVCTGNEIGALEKIKKVTALDKGYAAIIGTSDDRSVVSLDDDDDLPLATFKPNSGILIDCLELDGVLEGKLKLLDLASCFLIYGDDCGVKVKNKSKGFLVSGVLFAAVGVMLFSKGSALGVLPMVLCGISFSLMVGWRNALKLAREQAFVKQADLIASNGKALEVMAQQAVPAVQAGLTEQPVYTCFGQEYWNS